MAKVYCLFRFYPYEGDDLLGVFSTQEKAEAAKCRYLEEHEFIDYNELSIIEYTADALEEGNK